jgi:hypothetical protein
MEDPVKAMVVDAASSLGPWFLVHMVELHWGEGELRVMLYLRPRGEEATVSTWRIIELEERLLDRLGLEAELSHSRVGVTKEGLLLVTLVYRVPGLRPPTAPE